MFPIFIGLCGTFSWNKKDDFTTPAGDVEAISDNFVNRYGFEIGGEVCEPAPIENKMPESCLTYPEMEPSARMVCGDLFQISQECHLEIELEKMFLHHCVDVYCGAGKLVGSTSMCPLVSFVRSHCRTGIDSKIFILPVRRIFDRKNIRRLVTLYLVIINTIFRDPWQKAIFSKHNLTQMKSSPR